MSKWMKTLKFVQMIMGVTWEEYADFNNDLEDGNDQDDTSAPTISSRVAVNYLQT